MSSNNSEDQLNAMLEMAGKKLGISPMQLRNALSDPKKAQSLLSQIDQNSGGKINTSSPEYLEKIINNNPKAKKMFDDLTRGNKNG
jgi:hypothetical protein